MPNTRDPQDFTVEFHYSDGCLPTDEEILEALAAVTLIPAPRGWYETWLRDTWYDDGERALERLLGYTHDRDAAPEIGYRLPDGRTVQWDEPSHEWRIY